jgi:hypothetical protein
LPPRLRGAIAVVPKRLGQYITHAVPEEESHLMDDLLSAQWSPLSQSHDVMYVDDTHPHNVLHELDPFVVVLE